MDKQLQEEIRRVVQNTPQDKEAYRAFFEANEGGIQYIDVEKHIYYISRAWTIRGRIPPGATIQHTGLARAARNHKSWGKHRRHNDNG